MSIASFWEIAIKQSIGKLELEASVPELLDDCREMGFEVLPIMGAHLERLKALPFVHRDPFDRLLICQAKAENLTLVTVDGNITKYDVATVW